MHRKNILLAATLVLGARVAGAAGIGVIPAMNPAPAPSVGAAVLAPRALSADTPLRSLTFVAMDVETLGFWPEVHPLIEVGAAKFRLDEQGRAVVSDVHHSFANPHAPVPENIGTLTGITPAMLEGAPDARPAIRALEDFAREADVLMAHSAFFDTQYAVANGFSLGTPVVDTKALARRFYDGERTSLERLATALGTGDPQARAHRAHNDAAATAPVFAGLLGKLADSLGKEIAALTWGDLASHAKTYYGPKVREEAFSARPGDPTKADLDVSTEAKKRELWEEVHRVQFELYKAGRPNSLRNIARAMGVSYDALVEACRGIPTKIH
ncbi:MAG: PolC-type DNA polymerase III [Elusimicrobiota bacterium]